MTAPPAPAREALIATGEAARRCGVSRHTLRRAARRGELPTVMRTPGGDLRFHPADVAAFAAHLAQRSATAAMTNAGRARLVQFANDLMCVARLDGYFRWVNPAFTRSLGWSAELLLAQPFLRLVHDEDHEPVVAALSLLARGQTLVDFECRLCCADGSARWIAWTVIPQPAHQLLYGVGRDVTERRRLEAALRQNEAQLRALVDAAPIGMCILHNRLDDPAVRGIVVNGRDVTDRLAAAEALRGQFSRQLIEAIDEGIVIYDRDLRVLLWNAFMERTTGHAADAVIGRRHATIFSQPSTGEVEAALRRALAGERVRLPDSSQADTVSGQPRWFSTSCAPFRDRAGEIVGVITLIGEVTTRKQAEEERAALRQEEQRRADRLAALQAVTAALAAVRTPEAVVQVVVEQGRAALDAAGAVIRLLTPDGAWLDLVANGGFASAEGVQPIIHLPIDAVHMAAEVARTGRPRWIQTLVEFQSSMAPDSTTWHVASRFEGAAILPLHVEGRTVGILSLSFTTPQTFPQADRHLLLTLASAAAQTLERARLDAADRERARVAEQLAEVRAAQAAQAEAMATISAALSSTLEPEHLYTLILEQAVRLLPSDTAAVLLYADGWATVAAAWGSPMPAVGTRIFPISEPDAPWLPIQYPGAVLLADTAAEPTWVDFPPFLGAHRIRSYLAAPLVIDGLTVGVLNLHSTVPGYYREQDLPLAAAFAERVCLALRNARLYHAEQERRRAAEELAQLRNDFLSAVSHELRTPLTAIVGFAELLHSRWPTMDRAHRTSYLDRILGSANRQRRLVEDLLETSQLEAGVLRCTRAAFPLRPLLERAAGEVRGSYRRQRIDQHGPHEVLVEADADRTLQILINLLDNAAKYSPEGSPVVLTWGLEDGLVAIRVRDQGPGIPEAGRAALFTRFGRLPGSKARAGRTGTGLGLYLSRLLAEAMAGDLALEASGPDGSTFRLRLPAG